VLARPGVSDVIVLEGLNDLGLFPNASAEDVIAGLNTAVNQLEAFRAGGRPDLNVLVGTLTPGGGSLYGTPGAQRQA
jgi:hypothetical protein